jgi:hypothetical protein
VIHTLKTRKLNKYLELQLLLHAMQKTLESTVIRFLSVEQKRTILAKFWPKLILINVPKYQPNFRFEDETVSVNLLIILYIHSIKGQCNCG